MSLFRRLARVSLGLVFGAIVSASAGCAASHAMVIVDRDSIAIDAPSSVRLTSRAPDSEAVTARSLGEVNVVGARSLGVGLAAFAREVEARGGNLGVIDNVSTGFEVDERSWSESYACPFPQMTCVEEHSSMEEVAPVVLRGHAYRTLSVTR